MPIIESYPEPFVAPSPARTTRFVFDILPDDLADDRYTHWLPRVKADTVEYPIFPQVSLGKSENNASATLSFQLLNPSDKQYFDSDALIDFGIGKRVSGAWHEASFKTLLTGGKVRTTERAIANPSDRVSITVSSAENERLNLTSENGLIIYDPNKITILPEHLNPIIDDDENEYEVELFPIADLTFGDILQEVLVNRCGFTLVHTDLPQYDYYIEQYRVDMGQTLYSGLKPFMGQYHAAVLPIGDDIWIMDTTTTQPSGFPAPRQISLDVLKDEVLHTLEPRDIDGYLVETVGLANNFDFTAPRFEYLDETNGETLIEKEEIFIDCHKITGSGTSKVVASVLNISNVTKKIDGTTVETSSDVYEFTSRLEYAHRRKNVRA